MLKKRPIRKAAEKDYLPGKLVAHRDHHHEDAKLSAERQHAPNKIRVLKFISLVYKGIVLDTITTFSQIAI